MIIYGIGWVVLRILVTVVVLMLLFKAGQFVGGKMAAKHGGHPFGHHLAGRRAAGIILEKYAAGEISREEMDERLNTLKSLHRCC